jgi:hypothetical protein
MGLLGDGLLEKLDQGMRAHMPGYGTPEALPILGADRQLVQAPAESSASFIIRLKEFLQTWRYAGNAQSVLTQIRTYFTPYLPLVRSVSNSGVWDWYDAGQDTSGAPTHTQVSAWDWGSDWTALAGVVPWWRWWMLIFPGLSIAGVAVTAATNASPIRVTTSGAHGLLTGDNVCLDNVHGNLAANGYWTVTKVDGISFTLNGSTGSGAWTSGGTVYFIPPTALQTNGGQVVGPAPLVWGQPGVTWGTEPEVSWGFNVPPQFFQPMQQLAGTWKAAHAWLRWFVFSFDTSWGTPWSGSQPTGGVAPGDWGTDSVLVNGVWVASRNPNVRCVDGVI